MLKISKTIVFYIFRQTLIFSNSTVRYFFGVERANREERNFLLFFLVASGGRSLRFHADVRSKFLVSGREFALIRWGEKLESQCTQSRLERAIERAFSRAKRRVKERGCGDKEESGYSSILSQKLACFSLVSPLDGPRFQACSFSFF